MIFFDTETTGLIRNAALHLNKQPHIIEIGMVREPKIPGRPSQFGVVLKVPVKLEPIITKITGLTDEDLEDCPTFAEIYHDLAAFVKGETQLVAHNMPFDHGMLMFELRRGGWDVVFPMPKNRIDTVQMAKPFYKGRYMKLQTLYEDLVGPYVQKHRAIDDCIMLQTVYRALVAKGKACGNSSTN